VAKMLPDSLEAVYHKFYGCEIRIEDGQKNFDVCKSILWSLSP
jgi:hypothetical protein